MSPFDSSIAKSARYYFKILLRTLRINVIQRSTVQLSPKRAVLCDVESPAWSKFLTVYNHILDTLSAFSGIRPKVTRKMLENACIE